MFGLTYLNPMVRFLKIKGLALPVYWLHDPADQAAGFQHFQEIPHHFGLWFPRMEGKGFHMRNVGGELLACGLKQVPGSEHDFQICSVSMWKPEGSCSYKGDHVLECHPCHAEHLKVGNVVHLAKGVDEEDLRLASSEPESIA